MVLLQFVHLRLDPVKFFVLANCTKGDFLKVNNFLSPIIEYLMASSFSDRKRNRSSGGGSPEDGPSSPSSPSAAAASSSSPSSSKQPPAKKKTYSSVATTEKCRICAEPAAKHMHYGAITCFSCKAFFRRAIQNDVAREFICRASNNCEIGVQSRKHCQKCRFERCLAVGMKPGWVLSKVERQRRFRRRSDSADDPSAARGNNGGGGGGGGGQGIPNGYYMGERAGHMDPMGGGGAMAAAGLDIVVKREVLDDDDEIQQQQERQLPPPPPPSSLGPNPSPSTERGGGRPFLLPLNSGDPSDDDFEQAHELLASLRRQEQEEDRERRVKIEQEEEERRQRRLQRQQQLQEQQQQQQLEEERRMQEPIPPPRHQDVAPSPGPSTSHRSSPPDRATPADTNADADEAERPKSSSSSSCSAASLPLPPADAVLLPAELVPVDLSGTIMTRMSDAYDNQYNSVPFGAHLLKEIILSSLCGVPLSAASSIAAYRLMVERVSKVAKGSDAFAALPHRHQKTLLRHNADLMVLLQGALFFQGQAKGFDQIMHSMGHQDLELGKQIMETIRSNTGSNFKRIDYEKFNSIQKLEDKAREER